MPTSTVNIEFDCYFLSYRDCSEVEKMGRPRGSGSSYGLRRRSGGSVVNPVMLNTGLELMMECVDDALSTSQVSTFWTQLYIFSY